MIGDVIKTGTVEIHHSRDWTLHVRANYNDPAPNAAPHAIGCLFGTNGFDPLRDLVIPSRVSRADQIHKVHADTIRYMMESAVAGGRTPTRAYLTMIEAAMAAMPRDAEVLSRPRLDEGREDEDIAIADMISKHGAGRCVVCDGGIDVSPRRWETDPKADYRYMIVGRLCAECRNEIWITPEIAMPVDAPEDKGPWDAALRHASQWRDHASGRCHTCHVAFDSPRKLAAHKATPEHQTIAWIEYQQSIGNVVLHDPNGHPGRIPPHGIAGLIVMLFDIKPNVPTALGWWRTATLPASAKENNQRTSMFRYIQSLIAVPQHVFDLFGAAAVSLIELEISRVEQTKHAQKKDKWNPLKPYAKRIRVTTFPLLVAMAAHRAGIAIANPWLPVAWGLGPVGVGEHEGSGAIAHRIHEARREAFKVLGPAFFTLPHSIWGRCPDKLPAWARVSAD